MFNTLNHKGNENQNYAQILSHPSQNDNQENKQLQMLAVMQHCWCEYKPGQPLCKSVWRFIKRLNILPYDPATTLGHIFKGV
jgi:hypothetical protein